jgi:glutaminase
LHGTAISLFEFHGNLFFGNTEQAVRRILERVEATYLILDLGRVTSVDNAAANLLREFYEKLAEGGRTIRFAAVSEEIRERLGVDPSTLAPSAENALEESEDALLRSLEVAGTSQSGEVPLGDFELVGALDFHELEFLGDYLVKKTYAAGETIIKEGTAADSLYFLVAGSVNVYAGRIGEQTVTRLAAIDAGNVFGELALLSNRRRTADVIAASSVTALMLQASEFAAIAQSHPKIHGKLIAAVGESLSERLRRANEVILSLTR